ncbi:MAG: F0F1 ATP synthase subunit B, partial [Peptidiphaga gingivicola]
GGVPTEEALADEVNEARREAAQIRETAQSNAAAIVEDAKKNASVEAKRVADAAQRQIDADAKLARTQLRRDVGSLAAELAGRIVGEQALDPKVSSAVVDSFLDELEADVSAPAGPRPKEK